MSATAISGQLLNADEKALVILLSSAHGTLPASHSSSASLSSQPVVGAIAVIAAALIAGSIALWSSRYTIRQTLKHQRTQLFNDRFSTASDKLGHEQAATRLAGLYAMARLADDWKEQRQTCIDILCGYLRLPYEPDPASKGYREGEREVRRTIIRVIRDHLRPGFSDTSWCNHNFSFEGATFDCGDLTRARFTGGHVSFHGVRFISGTFHFNRVDFDGAHVWFNKAHFSGADVRFNGAQFLSGHVDFGDADFAGGGGNVSFDMASATECVVNWGPFKPLA